MKNKTLVVVALCIALNALDGTPLTVELSV